MEAHALSTRLQAVELYRTGLKMSVISAQLGVCYDTIRQWIKRYKLEGESALALRYANCGRPVLLDATIKQEALRLKELHPQWGAGFIRHHLGDQLPDIRLPQIRRLQQWFQAAGLQVRKTRLPSKPPDWAGRPFDRVQVDAKERLQTADGTECCYLTFTDEHSGSVLDAFIFPLCPHL